MGPDPVQDVPDPLGLGAQLRIRVHQMPRVQHDPRPRVLDPGEQILRLGGVQKGEARPPLVLHQEIEGGLHAAQQLVDELDRPVEHLAVRVQPPVGIALLQRHVGDVEHRVGRVHRQSEGQVVLKLPHQVLRPRAAVDLPDHFPAAELAQQLGLAVPVKVQPVGIEHHVVARQQRGRERRVQVVGIDDALNAVQPQGAELFAQRVPAPVGLDAVAGDREIDALDHSFFSLAFLKRHSVQSSRPMGIRQNTA